MTNELAVASAEIVEILKLLPEDEVNKIPKKLRELFNSTAKKDFNVNIDSEKRLLEQNISEKTKSIIAVLYYNYWCSPEEKNELQKVISQNEKEYSNMLREKYNPDNIFDTEKKQKNQSVSENTQLVEIKKKSIIEKIIEKIKKIFKII